MRTTNQKTIALKSTRKFTTVHGKKEFTFNKSSTLVFPIWDNCRFVWRTLKARSMPSLGLILLLYRDSELLTHTKESINNIFQNFFSDPFGDMFGSFQPFSSFLQPRVSIIRMKPPQLITNTKDDDDNNTL